MVTLFGKNLFIVDLDVRILTILGLTAVDANISRSSAVGFLAKKASKYPHAVTGLGMV